MSYSIGTRLGPYEIVALIGAGGMGEVFRARDTRLNRVVALKTVKERFSERFGREARTIAALNHPHICQLYDVGVDYLVMEYIEGKAVAGPLAIPEALHLAIQIADALDAAHTRGIVHRDLKPDNILVTRSGEVKLLDFGLAKIAAPAAAAAADVTLTRPLTQEGTIVGTLKYMSPEQLQGKDADGRADIFAFGAVLFEMLTGRPAFDAANPASIIAAILTSEVPAFSELDPLAPPALDRLLRRCLAKDPDARWQSARDLVEALKWIVEGALPASANVKSGKHALAPWIAAALCLLTAGAFGGYFLRNTSEAPPVIRVNVPGQQHLFFRPVISPDGSRIAFTSGDTNGGALWVRPLSSFEAQRIDGVENPSDPIWSPDSKQIAVASNGKLLRFDLTAGRHRTLCDLPPGSGVFNGSWGPSGVILFSNDDTIFRVSASGGEIASVTHVERSRGELKHVEPFFLPDGRRFLFLAVNQRTEDSVVYEGALDSPQTQRIMANPVGPVCVIGNHLIFARGSTLMAQPFDWKTARLKGEPISIQEEVYVYAGSYSPIAAFSASVNALAYYPSGPIQTELVWFDRQGARLASAVAVSYYTNPALSPDQKHIAVGITDPQTNQRDVWVLDDRGGSMRLTADPKEDFNPIWSPDGTRIAFVSDRKGARDIFVKPATGIAAEETVLSSSSQKNLEGWSPDGKLLIYNDSVSSIMAVPVEGAKKPFPVVSGPGSYDQGAISPDGKWIAYRSSDAGRVEIYVQSFPAGGARWQLSTNGGAEPSWRRDGKELYFVRDRQLFGVEIEAKQGGIERGTPKFLFTAPFPVEIRRNRYVPSADGRRFLVLAQTEQRKPIHVVLNWSTSLNGK